MKRSDGEPRLREVAAAIVVGVTFGVALGLRRLKIVWAERRERGWRAGAVKAGE